MQQCIQRMQDDVFCGTLVIFEKTGGPLSIVLDTI